MNRAFTVARNPIGAIFKYTLALGGVLGFVVFLILWIAFWPLAIIWALNTLFALAIPYSFWTWLAVVVLTYTLSGVKQDSKS